MKIATVVGARPQFVKAAMVTRALGRLGELQESIIHTGQHYDQNMSLVFFEELGIPRPHFSLGIGSGSHGAQTGQMLQAIEEVLLQIKPECVLVYGDTNSTLAGALAAAKIHIPIAHVEAGLRSFNRDMPEEINRLVTDHCSDLLFAPTKAAVGNLRHEGIQSEHIFQVGDVMYDATLHYGAAADARSRLLQDLGLKSKSYVLATVHRAENTDNLSRLQIILQALAELAREMRVVMPVHPRTRKMLRMSANLNQLAQRLCLIDPVGYLDMVALEKHACLIATDSGGVQKEAFFHQVPCITLRHETEWVELVELGWNYLAPPLSVNSILAEAKRALSGTRKCAENPYGDGESAQRIAMTLCSYLSDKVPPTMSAKSFNMPRSELSK
jgi:UDP-GlcNAc3NAcA epimerase